MRRNSLEIHWHPAALVTFYRLPMRSAEMIDRAVIRFAETGDGEIEWAAPYYRLYIGAFDLPLVVDRKECLMWIISILRR